MASLALMSIGCGSSKKSVEPNAAKPIKEEDSGPRRVVNSGKTHIKSFYEDGSQAWTMSVSSSRVSLDSDHKEAHVTDVEGEMYEAGKRVSTFAAPNGKVQSDSKQIVLWGGITITSVERGITLKADRLKWNELKRIYVAEGGVWIDSKEWRNGPMPEIWAEPDLDKFGTPEYFK